MGGTLRTILTFLVMGLLIAAVILDIDHHRIVGFIICGVAFAVLLYVAWRTVVMPRLPSREIRRAKINQVETDPDTQFRIHRIGAIYWLINFPVIIWLFFWHQEFWLVVGVFITLLYSVYANLATDYGAMSSAIAAKGGQPPPEIPLQED